MIEKPEFAGVNEDFEIIFNAARTENMNRAKVSRSYDNVSRSTMLLISNRLDRG